MVLIFSFYRLIIEEKEPHLIVHSNAAFSRLSDIPSDQLTGSSFATLINEKDQIGKIDLVPPGDELSSNDEKNQDSRNHEKKGLTCTFEVYQVKSKNQITHYVLDFKKDNESSTPIGDSSSAEDGREVAIKMVG